MRRRVRIGVSSRLIPAGDGTAGGRTNPLTTFERNPSDAPRPGGSASPGATTTIERRRVRVRGVVQGVGFRPFVWNLAHRLRLSGWVCNETRQVTIEVQGPTDALDLFLVQLEGQAPSAARIDELLVDQLPAEEDEAEFRMIASLQSGAPLPVLPADLAMCDQCRAEILDPGERRYRYPFTNCTQCGPRWSIVRGAPYDRPRTSMQAFAMCAACRAEYESPDDRRYHAQPIACPQCGPRLFFDPIEQASGVAMGAREHPAAGVAAEADVAHDSTDVPERVGALLRSGKIVALLGLGGFQLLVDATDEAAVAELRRRKRRPDKPFAVLAANLDEAKRLCLVSDDEARLLAGPAAPIVLLRRRGDAAGCPIATGVAPGNPYLGVMLPYTPLHELVIQSAGRPLVCTSGNAAEEPMAISLDDGRRRLRAIADQLVAHNRPIVRPVDDSVARCGPAGPMVLRRARGYAPLPTPLPLPDGVEPRPWLAVGGHLKNVVGVTVGRQAVLSAHIGDLDNAAALDVFRRAIDDLLSFYRVEPAGVVCDRHPDYASTRFAEQWAGRHGTALLRVQHHHAHAAACMAEHGLAGDALAFCWDGIGYGDDGTAWGGESLLCQGAAYRRFAHLRPFPLPGGDRAAREPYRAAVGLLFAAQESAADHAEKYARRWLNPDEWKTLLRAIERGVNTPITSSIGRLFDAVAALCGLLPRASFEGQAAMALEFIADPAETASYPLPLRRSPMGQPAAARAGPDGPVQQPPLWLDWQPLVEHVLADLAAGAPAGVIAGRFHNALVEAAVATAEAARAVSPQATVALTGGCFQNARLTEKLYLRLLERGFRCVLPRQFPPGDGGVALGQLYLAALSDVMR